MLGVTFGFIVLSDAMLVGSVSGACFNPAVAMLAVVQGEYDNLWVYICGPTAGCVLAWLYFHLLNPTEVNGERIKYPSFDVIFSRMSFPMFQDNRGGNMRRLISMLSMELIGSFAVTWSVALSCNAPPSDRFIAIGATVTALVYAGGAISGAHYNPAITLGVYLRGKLERPQSMRAIDAVLYCIVQVRLFTR